MLYAVRSTKELIRSDIVKKQLVYSVQMYNVSQANIDLYKAHEADYCLIKYVIKLTWHFYW